MMLVIQIALLIILVLSFFLMFADETKHFRDNMTAVIISSIIGLVATVLVPMFLD